MSGKQNWLMRHFSKQGARTVEIVRYTNHEKLLNQIFDCVPPGFEVSLNTPERIELTDDGKPNFYLEPVKSPS